MEGKTDAKRGNDVPTLPSQPAYGLRNDLGACYQIWHFALWVTYFFAAWDDLSPSLNLL